MPASPVFTPLFLVAIALLHLIGLACAVRALLVGRTAQGTVAWIVGLALFPYLALPLYSVFGLGRFHGYVRARRSRDGRLNDLMRAVHPIRHAPRGLDRATAPKALLALERLADLPFTSGNDAELLVDGTQTFRSLFRGISEARRYLLVQFYIIHDDRLGRALKCALIERAKAGIAVYVLYDEIGCHKLTRAYVRELRDAGVQVTSFNAAQSWLSRHWRLNFRNHRKIVVADGEIAWVGGLNVGLEYVDRHPTLTPWRDTHLKVAGPAALGCQLAFVEDWYWATGQAPDLDWTPRPAEARNLTALVLPTGPADELETCALAFGQMVATAQQRIWIANPYFVPDSHLVAALQLAALRGVDVRILMPARPDYRLVWLAAMSFIPDLIKAGVKIHLYEAGILHQKVALFDDRLASIGTANFDNRSFRLNFEIGVVVWDEEFNLEVARMLQQDFARSRQMTAELVQQQSFAFRLASQGARLLAPVL